MGLERDVSATAVGAGVLGFEEFYRDVHAAAARYASTVLGARRDELDDVLQDAWARAWRSWYRADPNRREAWFFRIVRNCCLDRHRAGGRVEPRDPRQLPERPVPGDATDPSGDGAAALLALLPVALRETLWLREVRDLSYAEIAEVQGIPIGTVMSRLHSARRRLARQLRGRCP